ncbi:PBP superfamily domain protein [bacterium BMS3Abin02]|nr:PBP superfamily domain protein [bacterium BMS3Abin02]GBE22774.1 PBP superfamily domain protein [bacterium BMS3Bbin01]
MKRTLVAAVIAVLLVGCAGGDRVIVAAGTTVVDSGFLDAVIDIYESEHPGVEVSIVGDATSRVLELGRRGSADLLITHAPDQERQFVDDGLAYRYAPFVDSRFVIVAPPDSGLVGSPEQILRTIARRSFTFVTRADGSGTNAKEIELWKDAGIDPAGRSWYLETGQGMGFTLQVADQRNAATLAELGAYLAAAPALSLVPVSSDDPRLVNPYHLIVVAHAPNRRGAADLAEWLLSPDGRAAEKRVDQELFGTIVYEPADPKP